MSYLAGLIGMAIGVFQGCWLAKFVVTWIELRGMGSLVAWILCLVVGILLGLFEVRLLSVMLNDRRVRKATQ